MRRILLMALMLAALTLPARAELHAYEYENTYYKCKDFDNELPQDAARAFEGALRPGDEVLCGAQKTKCFVRGAVQDEETSILLAVRREGKILLMHAGGVNGAYTVTVESDSFLEDGTAFDITATPDDEGTLMGHEILIGDETYVVSRKYYEGQRLWIAEYRRTLEDGRTFSIEPRGGYVSVMTDDGKAARKSYENGVFPERLAAWRAKDFPKTQEALMAYIEAHSIALGEDEAYILGVNLRERPTGESPSWGKYTARVRVLGKEPGLQAPWFQVKTGNLTGWASGTYVIFDDGTDTARLYDAAANAHDVGRALRETALADAPGGETIKQLTAGTLVHVLGERDGWLHVIVPGNELTWQTDWDGTYGFVRSGDMAVGISKADAMYKN